MPPSTYATTHFCRTSRRAPHQERPGRAPHRRENPNHWHAITRPDVAVSGNGISTVTTALCGYQHHLAEPIMNRDDELVWLSFAWFVALCGAAIWVLFRPASCLTFRWRDASKCTSLGSTKKRANDRCAFYEARHQLAGCPGFLTVESKLHTNARSKAMRCERHAYSRA